MKLANFSDLSKSESDKQATKIVNFENSVNYSQNDVTGDPTTCKIMSDQKLS